MLFQKSPTPLTFQTFQTPHPAHFSQTITVDVCVMGAGAVAAVAVLKARQLGLRVIQIAPHPMPLPAATVARTYAIAPAVQAGLANLGVWDLIPSTEQQICTQMHVLWQTTQHVEALPLSAQSANVPQLCTFVAETTLQRALDTVLKVTQGQQPNTVFYESSVVENMPIIQPNQPNQSGHAIGVRITTLGQPTIQAALCIVAEGANSRTAAQVDLSPTIFDYKHQAIVAELHASVSSLVYEQVQTSAWQWLGNLASGNDVLALLPMPPTQKPIEPITHSTAIKKVRYALVWSQPAAQGAMYAKDSEQLLAAINARIAWQAPQLGTLTLHSTVQQFPLFKSVAPRYIGTHLALVGDTAHKIHPLAGQGLNLGIEDVLVLFKLIAQREPWRSVGDARILARYQRQRTAQAPLVETVVHAIARRGQGLPLANGLLHMAEFGLRLQQDCPPLGGWLRRRLVWRATQALQL